MKKVILLLTLYPSTMWASASATSSPFEINFTIPRGAISVDATLVMNCRYEKFTFGGQAGYIDNYADYPLEVRYNNDGDIQIVTIRLKTKKHLYISGIFKLNKECMSQVKINFKDNIYVIRPKLYEPISFELVTNPYNFAENSFLDVSYLKKILNFKHIEFFYKPVKSSYVKVWMCANQEKLYEVPPIKVSLNPEANMPYRYDD